MKENICENKLRYIREKGKKVYLPLPNLLSLASNCQRDKLLSSVFPENYEKTVEGLKPNLSSTVIKTQVVYPQGYRWQASVSLRCERTVLIRTHARLTTV